VPPEERVAEFDQDGTLWVEHPLYTQVVYYLDRVPAIVKEKPELKTKEPFETVLSGNREAMAKLSMREETVAGVTITDTPTLAAWPAAPIIWNAAIVARSGVRSIDRSEFRLERKLRRQDRIVVVQHRGRGPRARPPSHIRASAGRRTTSCRSRCLARAHSDKILELFAIANGRPATPISKTAGAPLCWAPRDCAPSAQTSSAHVCSAGRRRPAHSVIPPFAPLTASFVVSARSTRDVIEACGDTSRARRDEHHSAPWAMLESLTRRTRKSASSRFFMLTMVQSCFRPMSLHRLAESSDGGVRQPLRGSIGVFALRGSRARSRLGPCS
jgi:hypothetical protein